ncbi:MAG: DUF3300 domain-containing protein [Phycisphaerae bacterium]|nr:DUF3300 domain-containing protein [Phycisphaerae bacterium]
MVHRLLLTVLLAGPVCARPVMAEQDGDRKPDPPPSASAGAAVPGGDRLTPSELEELLGPIALYPDTLLANVLAASVYPDEVAEAAAAVKSGASASQIDSKGWEAPVKAVAKVPDAMKMLGEYPDWTTALGQAYLVQAKDVMDVVQTLRRKATDNGALQSTPQQVVKTEPDVIYIESSDPEVIYVPSYEPSVVYVDDDDDAWTAGVIGFGLGVTTGLILSDLDCDWHGGCVGWGGGYGDVDIDIDRGDINVGGDVNIGNRVDHRGQGNRPRAGQEGNAWRPNQNKATAASRPSQAQAWRNTAAGQGQGRFPASTTSNWSQGMGTRRPTAGTRPSAGAAAGGQQRPAAQARPASPQRPPSAQQRPASASRVPSNRPPSAVPTDRGSGASRPSGSGVGGSRQSAGGGRSASAYSGGSGTRAASQRGAASRGGGGGSRGGGGRGGGRR